MIRGCERIETSARSIIQSRFADGENARGKMQGDVTKVTRCSRNGKEGEGAPGGNNPTYPKKKAYVGRRPRRALDLNCPK